MNHSFHPMTRPLTDSTALLFDADTTQARCRLCTDAQRIWVLPAPSSRAHMRAALNEMEQAARAGLTVVASLSYEAQSVFSAANGLMFTPKPQAHPNLPTTPYLQAVAYQTCTPMNANEARQWLAQFGAFDGLVETPIAQCIKDEFVQKIKEVRKRIAAGQTYQVNVTYPYTTNMRAFSPPDTVQDAPLWSLFAQIIEKLHLPFAGVCLFPESTVLSFSPELFFELSGNTLTTRPMKGTASVGENTAQTTQRAHALATDSKNRAENLMIVDLMRNDVARLAQTTRVTVPDLFTVRPYGAVLQMTSTVRAELSTQPTLFECFNALFPCGSITGAPKHETMRIIDQLEPYARGAYCGALGYIESDKHEQVHAVFNVPIRTLELPAQPSRNKQGVSQWAIQCSVGAGITYDSVAADEWDECVLKSQFFARHSTPFELIETMRVVYHNDKALIPHLKLHHQRMNLSAFDLGFVWNEVKFYDAIEQVLSTHTSENHRPDMRLRLSLTPDGQLHTQLNALEKPPETLLFDIATERMHSTNPMLAHKTSLRAAFNRALNAAKARHLFDLVFLNERGELTEGARSCLLVYLDGQWSTPPLSCGVLPSITRQLALHNQELNCTERVLHLSDLQRAEKILLGNVLYSLRPAQLVTSQHAPQNLD